MCSLAQDGINEAIGFSRKRGGHDGRFCGGKTCHRRRFEAGAQRQQRGGGQGWVRRGAQHDRRGARAIIVGVLENLLGAYWIGTELKLTVALALIVLVLIVRPSGLLGKKIVARV